MRTKHYFSPWLKNLATYQKVWSQIESALTAENELYDFVPNAADIWVRDFMPFQRHDGNFVVYRYNPDYLQGKDAKYITPCEAAFTAIGGTHGICYQTDLVIDGGNLIRCTDKNGTDCVIMTSKVLYENPHLSHHEILQQLGDLFDAEVILIPWDAEEEYGHADGMVRSIGKGRLLLNCYSDMDPKLGEAIKKAFAHRFELRELQYGSKHRDKSWCHLNYLELRNAVLVPVASIASDRMALKQIEEITGKRCIPISMASVVKQGGAMHCISWSMNLNC
ncbi:agmatine deiminase family protein [bacterium]|nr:agmatine deiminase family protein [bacterium]